MTMLATTTPASNIHPPSARTLKQGTTLLPAPAGVWQQRAPLKLEKERWVNVVRHRNESELLPDGQPSPAVHNFPLAVYT